MKAGRETLVLGTQRFCHNSGGRAHRHKRGTAGPSGSVVQAEPAGTQKEGACPALKVEPCGSGMIYFT